MERRPIFEDDKDRERFILRLDEAAEEYGARLYLFRQEGAGHICGLGVGPR